ncbi:hypothetical protein EJ05DRAFT_497187 [Pseudovirgaria hyperparasitica]|uniref:F-box domain-containing protein n=1 Tax=Pseudovirgaria hyperparasitica TaxID=470096 RepID=A0A6A6WHP8_9PEZI|nr:uncharacterized protein EJ05DRAFT_497187 [Pseudovirgaria hyperparasitica]KAF2762333.1 hypothetical protein EJ05DRAFT_497187 [Pseudovirgaria hyperparasitica]
MQLRPDDDKSAASYGEASPSQTADRDNLATIPTRRQPMRAPVTALKATIPTTMDQQLSSPFEKLPVEVLQIILSNLPDVLSLRSSMLVCRRFLAAVRGAEILTTTTVLFKQMDDVLPEAHIAQEALRLKPCTEDQVQAFITTHLENRQLPPKAWTLKDAVAVANVHVCVSELASQFINTAATKFPGCNYRPATRTEETRIQRAMYRFEIFCNLFRGFENPAPTQTWDAFFLKFSPWENEQLACVHDYFAQAVYPAFNDIAEHDIAWGEFRVEYDDERDSPFIQYVLSLGLEKLQRIMAAKSYETRYERLYSGVYPKTRFNFLCEALNHANRRDDGNYLSDFSPTIERTHINRPFVAEADTGPDDIWRWAHQDETWAHFVNQNNRETLREWGYVMWDRARLEECAIFHSSWEPPYPNEEDSRACIQRRAEMEASWEARSKIYMMGGKGWWSLGDHSRIIWPETKASRKGPAVAAHTIPKSLEEAREALSLMKLPKMKTLEFVRAEVL